MSSKLSQESHQRAVGSAPSSEPSTISREMPVLFRLQDVNHRPPAPRTPPPAAASVFAPKPLPAWKQEGESESSAEPFYSAPISAFAPAPVAISIPAPAPSPIANTAQAPSIAAEPPKPTEAQPVRAAMDATTELSSTTPEKPAAAPSLTIAERRQQRAEANQRKTQAAKPKDWFSSHLHLVAVGFVIALGATIYVARNGRQEEAPVAGPEITWEMEYPGDAAGTDTKAAESSPSPSATPAASVAVAPPADTSEASPAPVHELAAAKDIAAPPASPAEPQVNLLAPTVPITTAASAGSQPGQGSPQDPLFTWKGGAAGDAVAGQATTSAAPPAASAFENPGAVTNPYARRAAETAASAPQPALNPANGAGAPQAPQSASYYQQPQQRSPYILPNSAQDTLSPPGGSPYAPPAAAYTAAAPQYSAPPAAPQASAYQPAAAQPPLSPPSYGGSPAPSNAMPPSYSPATAYPPAASIPAAASGYPNTQTPNGYRYERSGSGLY